MSDLKLEIPLSDLPKFFKLTCEKNTLDSSDKKDIEWKKTMAKVAGIVFAAGIISYATGYYLGLREAGIHKANSSSFFGPLYDGIDAAYTMYNTAYYAICLWGISQFLSFGATAAESTRKIINAIRGK